MSPSCPQLCPRGRQQVPRGPRGSLAWAAPRGAPAPTAARGLALATSTMTMVGTAPSPPPGTATLHIPRMGSHRPQHPPGCCPWVRAQLWFVGTHSTHPQTPLGAPVHPSLTPSTPSAWLKPQTHPQQGAVPGSSSLLGHPNDPRGSPGGGSPLHPGAAATPLPRAGHGVSPCRAARSRCPGWKKQLGRGTRPCCSPGEPRVAGGGAEPGPLPGTPGAGTPAALPWPAPSGALGTVPAMGTAPPARSRTRCQHRAQ